MLWSQRCDSPASICHLTVKPVKEAVKVRRDADIPLPSFRISSSIVVFVMEGIELLEFPDGSDIPKGTSEITISFTSPGLVVPAVCNHDNNRDSSGRRASS
jgi:hypothetical protein